MRRPYDGWPRFARRSGAGRLGADNWAMGWIAMARSPMDPTRPSRLVLPPRRLLPGARWSPLSGLN
ncbi:hypothetical protein MPS_0445 [Mycobacterium pseudoshottsii JCM 15466]|nr:hypothetical protein MPS_0445 [Mycobacterium pseudoshottsii JCM 15466]